MRIDYVQAWRHVSSVKKNRTEIVRGFPQVLNLSNVSWFIPWVNKQFEYLDVDVVVIPGFKERPARKKNEKKVRRDGCR